MTPLVVVLAAGQGRRFREVAGAGQDKLLAPCVGRDGHRRPVIEQVLRNLPVQFTRRLLVTTADRPGVASLARTYGCQVLIVEPGGMGDSIAAAVALGPSAGGWLLVLGDMPFVLPASIEQVAAALMPDSIAVPLHQGERGHPVGFGAGFSAALAGLSGDRGAKRLFASARVAEVAVPDLGVLWDVDEPQALVF